MTAMATRSQVRNLIDVHAIECGRRNNDGRERNASGPAMRASLERLLRSVGLDVGLFASIPDFLGSTLPDASTCLFLDVEIVRA